MEYLADTHRVVAILFKVFRKEDYVTGFWVFCSNVVVADLTIDAGRGWPEPAHD